MRPFEILDSNVPAWYELSADGPTLTIRVHPLAAAFVRQYVKADFLEVTDLLESRPELPAFIDSTEQRWGFGPIISVVDSEDDWICWQCTLPQASKPDPDAWKAMRALTGSLWTLFLALYGFDGEIDNDKSQLLVIDHMAVYSDEIGAKAISAMVSKQLVAWIAQQEDQSRTDQITEVIKSSVRHIWTDLGGSSISECRCWTRPPKWIFLDTIGNSAGIGTKSFSDEDTDEGYHLVPDNTDSSIHLLTLLMGLAKLYELARADGF